MKFKGLLLNEIPDRKLQENFQRLQDYLTKEPVTNAQWRLFELTFDSDQSQIPIRHGLGFAPKDVIQTSLIGTGAITYHYKDFDDQNIYISVASTASSDPLVVRFLLGRLS